MGDSKARSARQATGGPKEFWEGGPRWAGAIESTVLQIDRMGPNSCGADRRYPRIRNDGYEARMPRWPERREESGRALSVSMSADVADKREVARMKPTILPNHHSSARARRRQRDRCRRPLGYNVERTAFSDFRLAIVLT
jgi:hypothetical protein